VTVELPSPSLALRAGIDWTKSKSICHAFQSRRERIFGSRRSDAAEKFQRFARIVRHPGAPLD
jgi:hypothetical protein